MRAFLCGRTAGRAAVGPHPDPLQSSWIELAHGRNHPFHPAASAPDIGANAKTCPEGLRQVVAGNRPAHPALLAGSQQDREIAFAIDRTETRTRIKCRRFEAELARLFSSKNSIELP